MTIPSRWIFHQHTICRFIMVHSMTISPVWFVILQCLMFDIWRLTHLFLYLLIQDYIHPNHHVIICHWLFQFTEISRLFSLFFPSFPGILLVLEFRSQQKPPRNDACKFNPSWSGCVSRGGGWTPWTPKLGALAAAKHHETIDNLCQTRPELRTLESNRPMFFCCLIIDPHENCRLVGNKVNTFITFWRSSFFYEFRRFLPQWPQQPHPPVTGVLKQGHFE